MRRVQMLGMVALGFMMVATDAEAKRGGALRGGVRGSVVGGMIGGSQGAATGAKVGVVAGATRSAVNREAEARTRYQSSAEYQTTPRSNFVESTPTVIVESTPGPVESPSGEAVIQADGKPLLGITFPNDWKQKSGDNFVSAVSADGQLWSVMAMLKNASDKEDGIQKAKDGLEKYLQDVEYDDVSETKGGALIITGTGQTKKGVDVTFAAGVFDAGNGQLAGAAFVVDSSVEDHYKEVVRQVCQTIRRSNDFNE
ncbi:hypothetical protein [Calycomorphotria hydatis]|uniref:Uncharacterized protein n=1 Tax=Calycomorphotria hydatis TaxID=2528027 RepID=A0A517TC88_9PLAN|nr:hypothetical protein [Calycomorphotria hydatis]QDT65988.1 hypothetical protein V22_32520 [Calycomorphotria hydatis]